MTASSERADVTSSIANLTIGSHRTRKTTTAKKCKEPVLDSWEDEDVDDDGDEDERDDDDDEEEEEEEEDGQEQDGVSKPKTNGLKATPPTPISPITNTADRTSPFYGAADPFVRGSSVAGSNSGARRPEKTDAVARRMIASALGVKIPRMTEEQRAYDRAIRNQERKRREEEKAAEKRRLEEAERARAAIWED